MIDIEILTEDLATLRNKADDIESRDALKRCEQMIKLLADLEATMCDPDKYLVYKHTDPNGKVYIGITKSNPSTRWNNGDGYSSQKKFYKAILKYGWINFGHEILAANLSEEDARELESRLIHEYNSIDPRFGYNTNAACTRDETLEDAVIKRSPAQTATPNSKPASTVKAKREAGNRAREVECLETGQSFKSATHAAKAAGVSRPAIYAAIKGGSSAAGFHWQYKNPDNPPERRVTQETPRPKQPSEIVNQFISEKKAFFSGKSLCICDESGERVLSIWSKYFEKWLILHGVEAQAKRRECVKQLEILADHRAPSKEEYSDTISEWVADKGITQSFITNTAKGDVFEEYRSWCANNDVMELGKKTLYKNLISYFNLSGKSIQRHNGKRYFVP